MSFARWKRRPDTPRSIVPELPDVVVYLERLTARIVGQPLERLRILNPFVLRSVSPPTSDADGRRVTGVRRIGKRIVLALEGDLFIVIHLMIAGRLRWRAKDKPIRGKLAQAALEFADGTLFLTEAGSKRRASINLVSGEAALADIDRGGLEPLTADLETFSARLISESHTLKRALTDPRLFSGIGNSYSDEILHRARLSPMTLTRRLSAEEIERLYVATKETLIEWTARLRADVGEGFPEKVTAFREGMAVHGRYRQPCPVCGSPVQRIVYAENETNYCARCQTGGKLLADRALSRLLREDWPKSIDEVD
jgi:formamidopyrimidine-DNA glycosylase